MASEGSLPIERIAALRAELDLTDRPDDVLAREGVSPAVWATSLEKLLADLADEVDRGDVGRTERFADIYEETRSKLLGGADAPRLSRSKLEPIDPSVDAAAEVDVDATAMTDGRAVLKGLKDRGLPFDPAGAPVPPGPAAPQEQSGETVEVDATDILGKLGIVRERPPRADPPSPAPTPPVVSFGEVSPPPPRVEEDVDATQAMDAKKVREALASPAIPFTPASAKTGGGTKQLDLTDFREMVRTVQGLPMPLESFVRMQAELSRAADRAATLRARGVDPATWPDVLRAFGEAMKQHPNLREQYERLLREATNR